MNGAFSLSTAGFLIDNEPRPSLRGFVNSGPADQIPCKGDCAGGTTPTDQTGNAAANEGPGRNTKAAVGETFGACLPLTVTTQWAEFCAVTQGPDGTILGFQNCGITESCPRKLEMKETKVANGVLYFPECTWDGPCNLLSYGCGPCNAIVV